MHREISITLSDGDRGCLEDIADDRKTPQKQAWRARIMLICDDGAATCAIVTARPREFLTLKSIH